MFDQIFQNLIAQSGSWISAIFPQAVLRQVAAFLVILVTAWLLQFLLRRLLYALASRFVQTSWTRPIFMVMDQALLLIMALILSQPVLVIFRTWGWTDTLLVAWLVPLLGIWLLYRLVGTLLSLNIAPTPARLWSTKVALPLLLLIWLFNGLGLLNDVLQWGPALGGNQRIMVGSVITGFVVIAIFFVLARGILAAATSILIY